ncbi:MAG: hypothetical protein N3F03_03490 [Ignavibacteria bacterium]|nr:hypothetical protein [Ignavibacteria bacterium]
MIEIDFQKKLKFQRISWFEGLKKGIIYSSLLHVILVVIIQILLQIDFNQPQRIKIKKIRQFAVELKEIQEPNPPILIDGVSSKDTSLLKAEKPHFAGFEIDTTEIINRYEENTLQVSILYPIGWTYLDNKVKDIIDGVIFFPGENSNYDRRISVLIQVNTQKNLFNPRLYDSSFTYNKVVYYISNPQKIYEQVTQTVYIRTGSFKADFLIKLTAPNEVEFKKFQPVFFAMVKSFSAGY